MLLMQHYFFSVCISRSIAPVNVDSARGWALASLIESPDTVLARQVGGGGRDMKRHLSPSPTMGWSRGFAVSLALSQVALAINARRALSSSSPPSPSPPLSSSSSAASGFASATRRFGDTRGVRRFSSRVGGVRLGFHPRVSLISGHKRQTTTND